MLTVLLLIIIVLLIALFIVCQKVDRLQKELIETKNYEESNELDANKGHEIKNKVWDTLNAIHLYASMSEEEAKLQSVKDKQKKIIDLCETILKDNIE